MRIRELIAKVIDKDEVKITGDNREVEIANISFDSRKIGRNSIFVAVKGSVDDGHRYINDAIERGASAVLCERIPDSIDNSIVYIQTVEARRIAGFMAHTLAGNPSEKMKVIGVTGTNGKTTVVTVLHQLFTALGYKCGMLSTVHNLVGQKIVPSTHTTSDAVGVATMMKEMLLENCNMVFMEVSSHAADQERIAGIKFTGGVFTNISRDHLDYHGTMLNYINAKKKFFDHLPAGAFALVNVDDSNGRVMVQNTKADVKFYGKHGIPDFRFRVIENQVTGMHLDLCGFDFHTPLVGEFNAYNLTACYGVAVLLGEQDINAIKALSMVRGAEGRLEKIIGNKPVIGFVDYAHTPDALENVILTLKNMNRSEGRLIVVFGCGGNRDAGKRPIMAKIASDLADLVILTSDNPRDEDPEEILDQMESGISLVKSSSVLRITDRKMAIKTAVTISKDKDIILVAGKGHEKFQEIKGKRLPFNDKEILKSYLDGSI